MSEWSPTRRQVLIGAAAVLVACEVADQKDAADGGTDLDLPEAPADQVEAIPSANCGDGEITRWYGVSGGQLRVNRWTHPAGNRNLVVDFDRPVTVRVEDDFGDGEVLAISPFGEFDAEKIRGLFGDTIVTELRQTLATTV